MPRPSKATFLRPASTWPTFRTGSVSSVPPETILETIRADSELSDAFQRCREYLEANGVDLGATRAALGPWVTLDGQRECFVGEFADRANELNRRAYRAPFVVPEVSA